MNIQIIEVNIDIPGGVERVISTIANGLSKRNKVRVLSQYKDKDAPFYKYDDSIDVTYIINRVNSKSQFDEKSIIGRIQKKLKYWKKNYMMKKKCKEYIKNLKDIDVIIFGRLHTALYFLPMIKKYKIQAKILVRDALFHTDDWPKDLVEKTKKYFPDMVDRFIVSSTESINDYKKFFDNKYDKVIKIYNPLGITPNKGFNYSAKTVVSVGRLEVQKGFDNLIKAFAKVHDNNKDWKLHIYGNDMNDGYGSYLQNIIDEAYANDYIQIFPSSKNVTEVLNNSSIYVMASRYEGYANALVEAMSCGMPCISYNWIKGVDEIITEDGVNGIIVKLKNREKYRNGEQDEEDITALSEKLQYLMNNEEACNLLGQNASKIVESRERSSIINTWERIIKDVTEEKSQVEEI